MHFSKTGKYLLKNYNQANKKTICCHEVVLTTRTLNANVTHWKNFNSKPSTLLGKDKLFRVT